VATWSSSTWEPLRKETVMAASLAHHPGTATASGAADDVDVDVTVGDRLGPALERLLGGPPPLRIEFWDGSSIGTAGPGTLRLRSVDAVRHLVWSPDELGLARGYVSGAIDTDGDLAAILRVLRDAIPSDVRAGAKAFPGLLATARQLGAVGARPPRPAEELVPHGLRHTLRRDRQVVSHHYDVGNEFYELILGPAMTYSCARFATPDTTLEAAQADKHELVCRKLGLTEPGRSGSRLLDVGCGWGSMAIHAATHHGVEVVGITISAEQAAAARRRVTDAGLADRVEIRLQDYREIDDGPFDAISSIGMAEHVGANRMAEYFTRLHELLRPGGRLLNHAISSIGGSRIGRRSFIGRYVFPDGELLDIADTTRSMEAAGFEVRDVENLREHYARTLRHWVANLHRHWDVAVSLVGEPRARVWLLYMSGSINGFDDAGIQVMQTLGVKLHDGGTSEMPATRAAWG
jgi:cyclopropane-fatty-acyl-phospholipid synthase